MLAAEPDPAGKFAALDPAQLLQQLVDEEDNPPLELIDACAAHGEVMVEALRAVIESEPPWTCDNLGEWWLLLHAAMILGRMPSESAGLLLVRLMRRIDEHDDANLKDWISDIWMGLFANKPAGVEGAIQGLVKDRSLGWFTRGVAAAVLLARGARQGGDALEARIDWIAAQAANESDDPTCRATIIAPLFDFPRERHRALLTAVAEQEERRWAERHGIFNFAAFTVADVDVAFSQGTDNADRVFGDDPWAFYDPEAAIERQARWQEEAEEEANGFHLRDNGDWEPVLARYVRPTRKVGRNEPCPCGSGRKYKHCCLGKPQIGAA